MRALNYELIIRRAYNYQGRTRENGAEADIYRAFERLSRLQNENENEKRDYYIKYGEIKTYLINAIKKILKDNDTSLTNEQKNEYLKVINIIDNDYRYDVMNNAVDLLYEML
jgi:hypothetical protein